MKIQRLTIISGQREINLIVQIADTTYKIEKGLMFVESLPENAGMLFVFPEKRFGGFWMKNTFIPLSIAFIDSDGKILKMMDMEPCFVDPCPFYDPQLAYQYAIEVNQGWFKKNQIEVGDYVKVNI